MTALYNEIDPHAAQWLRNLISRGAIAPGDVNESSISDLRPSDVAGYAQVHFFAGIGIWSYGLRLAGWPDDRPVWTGSCPCQPFSDAGQGAGFADERHLWPDYHWLIDQCGPDAVFGEQVASKAGLAWFDLVCADMEGTGYSIGSNDLCAAGAGAPHIRQRLLFAAKRRALSGGSLVHADVARLERWRLRAGQRNDERLAWSPGSPDWLANGQSIRRAGRPDDRDGWRGQRASGQGSAAGGMADATEQGRDAWRGIGGTGSRSGSARIEFGRFRDARELDHGRRPGPVNGFWRDADWLSCTDSNWRPVEPGTQPLVDGAAFRVGSGRAYSGKSRSKMLKGYGNALVAPLIAEFVRAAMGSPFFFAA